MSKLQELRKKRAALVGELTAMTAKADAENRDFNTQEETEWNEKETEAKALASRIDREERMISLDSGASSHAVIEPAADTRAQQATQNADEPKKVWRNMGEFLQAVVNAGKPQARVDPRLFETRAASGANETVSSDGGFLVQHDFAAELLKRTYETGILASKVKRIPISAQSNGLKINAIDETSRVAGSRYGGIQSYWASEAGTVTAKKPKYRQIELNLHKLMGLCYVTDELMMDSVAMDAVIKDAFVSEFAYMIDDAILNGDGSGKPLGILNAPGTVSVAKETSQTAVTVNKENLVKMRARLFAKNRSNAVWFINQDVETSLQLLTLGDLGVYFPGGTFANQPLDQLFGRPVIPIEQCATLGTVGDIVFMDLSEYLMIDKGSIDAQSSIHVRFLYDELAFRFTYRVDGQPLWNSPLTPAKGSNTLSPYVSLATRA